VVESDDSSGRWLVQLDSGSSPHDSPGTYCDGGLAVVPSGLGSRTLRRTDKDVSGPSLCGARWHGYFHDVVTACRA
jgi:hypothetical protein